jgi:SH3-like domain-containing protein
MSVRLASLVLLAALLAPAGAVAQSRNPADGPGVARYLSLRSDEVNVRTGPGVRYPVEWILRRRNLPVEVVAEFENWRRIRDFQGTEGWVHQSMLSGRRYAVVLDEVRTLRRAPETGANPVARAEPGVVAQLLECRDRWCRVDAGGNKGWLTRAEIWGVYPNEIIR